MKNIFKNIKIMLTLIIDLFISVGSPFIVHVICKTNGVDNFPYPYLFAIFIFINAFLSYFVGDMIVVIYKKKNHIVTSSIPEEVSNASKQWRYPFIISLLAGLIIFIIFYILYKSTGIWPLM